jgi:beta-lactamase regulating signal transducer with metallopeptidase domain
MTELLIVFKAALLLLLGLTATALAGRWRASRRHLMLAATFAGVLVLPLAAVLLPSVRLELAVPRVTQPVTTPDVAPSVETLRQVESVARVRIQQPGGITGVTVLRITWAAVALTLLLQMLASHWRLRRIRRYALPWNVAGIPGRVDVLLHCEIAAPLALGYLRPAILLPTHAPEWEPAELRRAIVHELEHIRRADWPVQLMVRIVCSLYWFLPLSWIAWRRLCTEAERSCDDAVLRESDSAEYADQLVQLARRLSDAAPPALAMAGRSDLSARVRSILDASAKRGSVGVIPAVAAIAVAFVVVLGLGPVVPALVAGSERQAAGIRVRAVDRALIEAAQSGDLADINELLNAGANVNCVVSGDGTPLIVAARRGSLTAVQLLLERSADVNLPASGDGNPLIAAAARGQLEIVDLLLKRGARIEDVVPGDENALIRASGGGHLDVVKLLVSRGANVNARVWADGYRGSEWRTPLNMAMRGRHLDVVSFLKSAGAVE